jgi:hypothetical protein
MRFAMILVRGLDWSVTAKLSGARLWGVSRGLTWIWRTGCGHPILCALFEMAEFAQCEGSMEVMKEKMRNVSEDGGWGDGFLQLGSRN